MAISDDELTEIVGQIVDPELRRDLRTMGMLRGVSLAGGSAHVPLALPSEDWPARDELTNLIDASLASQDEVEAV